MRTQFSPWALALVAGVSLAANAVEARDTIQIAGSSTVLPFASVVAEEFSHAYAQYKTPVVGSGGTGGGLRQFCQGVGTNTLDIANASRAIKDAEVAACQQAGVKEILEVQIGYDGIVFASRTDGKPFALTPEHIFTAAAAEIMVDGKQVKNPYTHWSQIDKKLPDQSIMLIVPASNHGTREVFEERVLAPGCAAALPLDAMSKETQDEVCKSLRNDGRVVEVAGDYSETLVRLQVQPEAVGVFGLGFYEQNRDRLQLATVDGVTASAATISSGEYPVSRPLFIYVKGEHLGAIKGLKEYVEYFLSEDVSGAGSPLEDIGLIPLPSDEREQVLQRFTQRQAVTAQSSTLK